jgi:hypothetical protein
MYTFYAVIFTSVGVISRPLEIEMRAASNVELQSVFEFASVLCMVLERRWTLGNYHAIMAPIRNVRWLYPYSVHDGQHCVAERARTLCVYTRQHVEWSLMFETAFRSHCL